MAAFTRSFIRHRFFINITFILLISLFLLFWAFYFYAIEVQNRYIYEKAIYYVDLIKKHCSTENTYIKAILLSKESLASAIKNEDKAFIKAIVDEIVGLSIYNGAILLKNTNVLYKTGDVSPYNFLNSCQSVNTRGCHNIKIGENIYGFTIFSLPYHGVLLLSFNWNKFIKRRVIFLRPIYISLMDSPPKKALYIYPLLGIDDKPVSYMVFDLSKETILFRRKLLFAFILSSLFLIIFICMWIVFIKKEKKTVRRILKAIGDNVKGSLDFEYGITLALKTLYAYRLYKEALGVAINTKNVKETIRALALTLADIVNARHWVIVLFSDGRRDWKALLWSLEIDETCINNEVLAAIKENRFIVRLLLRLKKSLPLEKPEPYIKLKDIPCLSKYDIGSIVIIPMALSQETIGFLVLVWDNYRKFSTYDKLIFEESRNIINEILKNSYNIQDTFWLSYRDPLLGIYNRRILQTLKKGKCKGALIYFDLDNFKYVNDTYGHDRGDQVLKEFVNIVKNLIRKDDVFLRYGGDEFILYLKEITLKDAKKIRRRIEKSVKEAFSQYNITVSSGVVGIKGCSKLSSKIKEAEERMYKLKRRKHMKDKRPRRI